MAISPDQPETKDGATADSTAKQQLQFHLFAESVRDYAIFLLDPQGYVISWNPGAERFKGYKASEIIGRHFSTFYTEEDRQAEKPAWELEEAAREGRVRDEGWRVRKDGTLFWADVVITAIRDEQGRLLGFGKVTRDLTERRQAEVTARQLAREEARRQEAEGYGARLELLHQQLQRALHAERAASREVAAQREFVDKLLQQMPVAVVTVDEDGTYIQMNERARQLLGASIVGKRIAEHGLYQAFHEDGEPYAQEDWPLWRALHKGETTTGEEVQVILASGERSTFLFSATPLRDPDGKIISAVAAIEDITSHKQAQELAERQARFREQFIGVLSHDLRNPLASIRMGSQLLLRRGLPPEIARKVGRIAGSAERMERMIADLLDLTRSRLGGGIPITPQPTDLVALCQHVLEEARATHPGSLLSLNVGGNTWGDWDPDRIMQLLSNLVDNAISYGRQDGLVTLSVRGEAETVEISVHNEGPEIPEGVRSLLFDPYRRGAQQLIGEGGGKGLGLGLYISKQIALAHAGTIRFESTGDAGTTFCVVLPRKRE